MPGSPKVITCSNMKGGVGKTTTAGALAKAASDAGMSVLLVDADPQQSLMLWSKVAADGGSEWDFAELESMPSDQVGDVLRRRVGEDFDVVVIDCPPTDGRDHAIVRASLRSSDFVVVPTTTSITDLSRLSTMLELADSEGCPSCVLINRARKGTAAVAGILDQLAAQEIPAFGAMIPEREAVAQSLVPHVTAEHRLVWQELADALELSPVSA